jgi:hypothetical protein
MVHLSVIRILRLVAPPTVRIRDLNRRFGGLQVSPRLRFKFAYMLPTPGPFTDPNNTEAPATRDVDDAAPFKFGDSSLLSPTERAVWRQLGLKLRMPREPEQRAPLVWSCYATRSVVSGPGRASRRLSHGHLVKQLLHSEIVKDLGFTWVLPGGCLPSTAQQRCRRDGVRSALEAPPTPTGDSVSLMDSDST